MEQQRTYMTTFKLWILGVLSCALLGSTDSACGATVTQRARMYFNVGSVDFDLYGDESPLNVENFLGYVNDGAYDRTWIHRSFCCGNLQFLQGGDIYLPEPGDGNPPDLNKVVAGDTVLNEYDPNNGLTNSPGTLSAARQTGLDTARNGWFINTSDNSTQFPDYTVFGEATRGFNVVQFISSLPINHPYLSSYGYNTAPVNNNFFVYLYQVVERSPLDGDYDLDGSVGASDLAKWEEDYGRVIIAGPDFNGDKEIDSADLSNWEAGYGIFDGLTTFADFDNGDATRDGIVDGLDFLSLQQSYGNTTDVSADADGDSSVSGKEFLVWQQNFGATSALSSINSVPEPATLLLLCLGALAKPRAVRLVLRRTN